MRPFPFTALMMVLGTAPTACHAYAPGVTTVDELVVDGRQRSLRVRLPSSYDGSVSIPVVLMFHGGGGNARQLENRSSHMDEVAQREGFATVYPDGTGNGPLHTWNSGNCCGYAHKNEVDDVAFVRALLDHLGKKFHMDTHRVFAAGMSNGAMMAQRLGCELSDRIAAVGSVAGSLNVDACTPSRPVAMMEVHGSRDGHVRWEGGYGCGPSGESFLGVDASLQRWARQDRCAAAPAQLFHQEGNGKCMTQGSCAAGVDVVLCTLDGSGHSWPGGKGTLLRAYPCRADGPQSASFPVDEVLWKFFAAHPM